MRNQTRLSISLGRISFRAVKEKRDYLGKRKSASWMYMSRLAAQKEWEFMKVGLVLALGRRARHGPVGWPTSVIILLDPLRTPISRSTTHRSRTTLHPHGGYRCISTVSQDSRCPYHLVRYMLQAADFRHCIPREIVFNIDGRRRAFCTGWPNPRRL